MKRSTGRRLLGLAVVAVLLLGGCKSKTTGDDIPAAGPDEPAARLVREQSAGSCVAPPFPGGTRTPDGEDPLANVAVPTPQPPDPKALGAPSNEVTQEINAAIRNFVNCWNTRNFKSVVTLSTPSLMKSIFVQVKPVDLLTDMDGLPEVTYDIKSLSDTQRHADGRVSIAFHYLFVHQHRQGRWYFIKQNGWWLMDREARVTPQIPGEQSVIDVLGKDYSYTVTNPKVGPVTVLRAHNDGPAPHEFILVRIKEGVPFDPLKFLQPGVKPEGVEFYAQTVLDAGLKEDMVLTNVTPGQYIFLCLLRHPNGIYHPAAGMVSIVELS